MNGPAGDRPRAALLRVAPGKARGHVVYSQDGRHRLPGRLYRTSALGLGSNPASTRRRPEVPFPNPLEGWDCAQTTANRQVTRQPEPTFCQS